MSQALSASFRRLAWSNLLAQSAEQLSLAAVPIVAVLLLKAGPGEIGLLASIQSLPFLLLSMPLGLLADRTSRTRLMALADKPGLRGGDALLATTPVHLEAALLELLLPLVVGARIVLASETERGDGRRLQRLLLAQRQGSVVLHAPPPLFWRLLIGGGWGAKRSEDGVSATVCINDGDTHNSPHEQLEAKYPLMVERHALLPDSGGPGLRRGGLGVECVVQALNDYDGAVVLVSHDRHMLELTADRLVLVDGGTAKEFAGSIEDYTDFILGKGPAKEKVSKADRKEDKKAQAAAREAQSKLKREVSDAEADLAKLEVVLSAIDRAMFDPASAANEYKNLTMGELSQRRGKIVAAQEAAEARWVAASEALEKA